MDADVIEPVGIGDLGGLFAAVALFMKGLLDRHQGTVALHRWIARVSGRAGMAAV